MADFLPNVEVKLLEALREVLPDRQEFIALHRPSFQGNEGKYVQDCIDTGWVSSVGKYVEQFEIDLARFTGVKKAVAVVNGTAALHVCLILSGVESGDEVLMPALTFVATANAISYCGAIPHFVEVEKRTLGVDAVKLREYLMLVADLHQGQCINKKTGRRIKALVPMHTFGHPVDLKGLLAVCDEFNIVLIEDAAESLGSFYLGKHTGNFGLMAAVSFNGNKIITTGGGGAILTNDLELAAKAKHLTTTAKVPHAWEFNHDQVGFNYRLPNINAALGVAQLEHLPAFVEEKRNLAARYRQAFTTLEGFTFFEEPAHCRSNYWLNTLVLDESLVPYRDKLLATTNRNGLMTRPVWRLMSSLVMFQQCPRMPLDVSENLEKRIINIPSSVGI